MRLPIYRVIVVSEIRQSLKCQGQLRAVRSVSSATKPMEWTAEFHAISNVTTEAILWRLWQVPRSQQCSVMFRACLPKKHEETTQRKRAKRKSCDLSYLRLSPLCSSHYLCELKSSSTRNSGCCCHSHCYNRPLWGNNLLNQVSGSNLFFMFMLYLTGITDQFDHVS